MNIRNSYAGIMTADIGTAAKWYAELLGRSADYTPMDILKEWDFPEGGVLQLVEDTDRAGRSSITLLVDKIGTIRRMLGEKSIPVQQHSDSDIAKTINIHDPEGNRITFAENVQGR